MSNAIVADGPMRFAKTEAYRARVRAVEQAVAARYATRLAEAGFLRRLLIRYMRYRELRRELTRITPSPLSCWFGLSRSQKEEGKPQEQENA